MDGPAVLGQQLAALFEAGVGVPELGLEDQATGCGGAARVVDGSRVLARVRDGLAGAGCDVGVRLGEGEERGTRALDGEESGDETKRSCHVGLLRCAEERRRARMPCCELYRWAHSVHQNERAIACHE